MYKPHGKVLGTKEFNLNGTAYASYSTGPWNAMARATSFQSNEVELVGSIVPRNTNRLSFEASRKFNRVVNSPWSSIVGYEFATRFGFADDDVSIKCNPRIDFLTS